MTSAIKREERLTLALAAIGHVALFAILSFVWVSAPKPLPLSKPIDVSLVDAVALDQHAPPAPEPPAQSAAPEAGPPEDAPPPAKAAEVAPDPAPPKPQAVPPPKPVADKPVKSKPQPAKPAVTSTKALAATKATAANPKASKAKATGSLLDDDFRKGLTQSPSKSKSPDAAPGATMDAKASADIGSAIRRQVQPCADRQSVSGPGVSRIVVQIRLQLNRDGSLASRPVIVGEPRGTDDDNRIYVDAVNRAAIAAFSGCAPLRGLPLDLYDVPRGWKTFSMLYHLPG